MAATRRRRIAGAAAGCLVVLLHVGMSYSQGPPAIAITSPVEGSTVGCGIQPTGTVMPQFSAVTATLTKGLVDYGTVVVSVTEPAGNGAGIWRLTQPISEAGEYVLTVTANAGTPPVAARVVFRIADSCQRTRRP